MTPPHIVPEWYFLPYYAILRAIPSKLFGVIAMFSSIAVLFLVPWLDTSRVRSTKYRPIYRWFFWLFVFTCVALGYLGSKPPDEIYVFWARDFHGLLFRALPSRLADRRPAGETAAAARLHHRGGAGQERGAIGIRRGGKGLRGLP